MKAIINSRIVTKETVLTGHVLVYDESGIQQTEAAILRCRALLMNIFTAWEASMSWMTILKR